MMAICSVFINYFSKKILTKKNNVKNESAASRGGLGKLTYFAWPPLEVGLSYADVCLFPRCFRSLNNTSHTLTR